MTVAYLFICLAVLLLMILIIRAHNRFEWLKAGLLFICELVISTCNFALFFGIAYLLLENRGLKLGLDLGSVFLLLAVFVILSGVLLFLGLRLFDRWLHFETTTLTLIEYYIQWSLIYVTVYQTLFSKLGRIRSLTKIVRAGHLLNPNMLIVMVLPSFISVWISVIAFKKHKHVL